MKKTLMLLALCAGMVGTVSAQDEQKTTFYNRWNAPQKIAGTVGALGGAVGTGIFAHKAIQHKKALNRIDAQLKQDPDNQQLKNARSHHKKWHTIHALLATGSGLTGWLSLLLLGKHKLMDNHMKLGLFLSGSKEADPAAEFAQALKLAGAVCDMQGGSADRDAVYDEAVRLYRNPNIMFGSYQHRQKKFEDAQGRERYTRWLWPMSDERKVPKLD